MRCVTSETPVVRVERGDTATSSGVLSVNMRRRAAAINGHALDGPFRLYEPYRLAHFDGGSAQKTAFYISSSVESARRE